MVDFKTKHDAPLVSVTVTTYNHGYFLAECLDSILKQETNFPFEVICGDDASTDKATLNVIREYSNKNIPFLKIYRNPVNLGPVQNGCQIISQAVGKYIAFIDGDDVMYPGKLQAQVELLEAHPDCAVVFHDLSDISDASDEANPKCRKNISVKIFENSEWLKRGCFLPHSAKMYRRDQILTNSGSEPLIDFLLHLEHSRNGKIYYIDSPLGGKRLHDGMITRDKKWQSVFIDWHLNAYDRAIELGYDERLAVYGKIRFQQGVGLTFIAARRYSEAVTRLRVDEKHWNYASPGQKMLSYLSKVPNLIGWIQIVRHFVRSAIR